MRLQRVAVDALWLLLCCGWAMAKPAPELDEDCEQNSIDTMHDFCCDLHDESPHFSDCQMDWHEKIHYRTEQEEQTYMFCTAECTFNSTDFVGSNRQSLDLAAVREHLESELANDEDEALLYQTYSQCEKHALSLLPHKSVKLLAKRMASFGCHPFAGLVMECVANEMILNCPARRFHQTPQCVETRNQLRQCKQSLKYIS
ncbi:uncharacterized protein Obp46a [Drosophila pseudoobscura]|uniref:Uncharacterized protein Obp46a n=1 Tax=Drosophila pseudoobscura pseudoobscura TaxID=46245 RepID=A0A6I8UTS8_DROPS|nr:uncharacterized protein LOC4804234 [Drosophila pseudoobscura]